MVPEETITQDDVRSDNTNRSKTRNRLLWVQGLAFAAGIFILFFLLYAIGFRTIAETVGRIGWGFLIIVATNGLRHLIRALCLYLVIPKEYRTAKYRNFLAARLAGDAVAVMTFTGPLVGEATKAALLKKHVTFAHSAAAVIVDNILYYISVALMVISGIALMLLTLGVGVDSLKYVLAFVAGCVVLLVVGVTLAVRFDLKPMSFVLLRLERLAILPAFISSRTDRVFEIEKNVFQVYLQRPTIFYLLLGLDILAHAVSVTEVYLGLLLLNFTPTVTNAYIIESVIKVVNLVFSFVPGAIGFYEGGNSAILNVLGYTAAVGVALALIRRGAILFWAFFGVLILLWRTIGRGAQRFSSTQ